MAEGTLVLFNWADYFPPDLLDKFETETGIHVVTEIYQSNEDLLDKLRSASGHYDVVVPSDYMVEILIEEGLLQPVDAARMPNFAHVRAPFDDPWFDPARVYSVPNMNGTSGFMYDPRQVVGGLLEESWSEFFAPRPEIAGKIVALDDQYEMYRAAAYYAGVNPCTENPTEAQHILDVLQAQKPKLAFYTSGTNPNVPDSLQDGIDLVTSGSVAILQIWDGGARLMQRSVPEMIYVVPKEGSAWWQDAYAVPSDAWNPENAKIFLNWIMQPENIAAVSNFTGYTNAIAGSEAFMDEAVARDQLEGVAPAKRDRLRPVEPCSPAARELSDKVWARLWPRTVK
ncbi:MAG: extracellular solute-binding protein [Bauldia sp.]|nr:extracellular solute-binding protein [Bauldia sp.]